MKEIIEIYKGYTDIWYIQKNNDREYVVVSDRKGKQKKFRSLKWARFYINICFALGIWD